MYAEQFEAIQIAGYSASLCPDSVIQEGKPLRDIPEGATVVYRGWMLNPAEYTALHEAVMAASATMLTSPDAYLSAHHLPNWYPLISEYTPETIVLSESADLENELTAFGWDGFFIKDYVKSLKTSVGSFIRDPSQIESVIAEMKSFRGELEGGLCIRKIEPLDPDSEVRHFVLNGKAFSPSGAPCPEIVLAAASRIPSPYFSVDVIRRDDGELRIVEVGDGQVSDLAGWSVDRFAEMWNCVNESAT